MVNLDIVLQSYSHCADHLPMFLVSWEHLCTVSKRCSKVCWQVGVQFPVRVFCCFTMQTTKPGCVCGFPVSSVLTLLVTVWVWKSKGFVNSFHVVCVLVHLTQDRELSIWVGGCPVDLQTNHPWVRVPRQGNLLNPQKIKTRMRLLQVHAHLGATNMAAREHSMSILLSSDSCCSIWYTPVSEDTKTMLKKLGNFEPMSCSKHILL